MLTLIHVKNHANTSNSNTHNNTNNNDNDYGGPRLIWGYGYNVSI